MKKYVLKKLAIWGMVSVMTLQMYGCANNSGSEKNTSEQATETETSKEESSEESTVEVTEESTEENTEEGTGENTGSASAGKVELTLENLPILDGATANEPYYEGVVARMLGVDKDTARANVLCSTTKEAFNNLINKTADMIFVSYPSKEQEEAAKDAGVEFEYHQILTGAFVFFVNVDNPVDALTLDQIRGIYRGEITNWKEVGGNDEPIVAFQREEGSGSQNGLYRYILDEKEVMKAPEQYYFSNMEDIVYAFGNANYDNGDNAIGYSYYYYVANMKCNDKIKLIKVDGIEPTNETIGKGEYPFCNPTLAIVRKGTPADSPVYTIIDWIMSDEGAKLAEELGYVANRSGGNTRKGNE